MGFFEFWWQLAYKAKWGGGMVVEADRWFPSSESCMTGRTVQKKCLWLFAGDDVRTVGGECG